MKVQHQQHSGLTLGHAVGAHILYRVLHLRHILQTQSLTVHITQYQRGIVLRSARLVIGFDLPRLGFVLHHAFRAMGVVGHHRLANHLQRNASSTEFVGVYRYANRRQSTAANGHLPHTINLGQALGQSGGGHVVHLAACVSV